MDVERTKIIDELDRIGASTEFHAKPVMKRLLAYLVTEHIEGRSDQIKGYSIGLDVFGQGTNFDPARSALVRNNALRLRNLLTTYYLGEGKNDPVRIVIPKGKYIPHISKNHKSAGTAPRTDIDSLTPAVAVLPFSNMTGDPALDYLATGFSQGLSDALTKFDDLRVIGFSRRADSLASADRSTDEISNKGVGFLIDGEIQAAGTQVKISFQLLKTTDDSQIWSDSVRFDVENNNLFDIQEMITERIASLIGGEYGHINSSRFQALFNSRPRSMSEQHVLLKHYHHVTVLTEESRAEFHQATTEALEKDPDSALLNACAAGLYSENYTFAYPDADEALAKTAHHAEKAYVLNPNNQWVLGNLGFKCFLFDERDRFFGLFERIKDTLANSPLRLGGWAIWICYFGEWERGKELLDRVFDNNLHVPLWLHCVTCLYYYRKHDYETALAEANKIQIPGLHWGPAMRAIALSQLGRLEEAKEEFAALLECRPDFVEKGRHLIGWIIKETSLLEHVFEGFAKIGVKIA